MKKVLVRGVLCIFAAGALFLADPASANAAGSKPDPKFDHKYYADTYPDLKQLSDSIQPPTVLYT